MDSTRFSKIFVAPDGSLKDAIECIDAGAVEIALMAGDDRRLIGTISDGDVRRALLRGADLAAPAESVANREPVTAAVGTPPAALLELMVKRSVEQIPLIENDTVVDLAFIRDLMPARDEEHPVVIMAGGEGQRLRPLTEGTPKPMLPVGEAQTPLLEVVLDQVRQAGFSRVMMAVNYQSDKIESHFGDGSAHGLEISYVHEQEKLGSAGALQLVREQLDRPFIVMNADLLTKVSLDTLLRFHLEEKNVITVGVRQYVLEVPYGVVQLEDTRVTGLEEKPSHQFYVNAGIYAVSPEAIELIPDGRAEFNMTDLIDWAFEKDRRVGGFPIREYWLDVGQVADYERAHDDHATYFTVTK